MAIQASPLGPALVPAYSFYSITEVSEYVPGVEEYGRILRDARGSTPRARLQDQGGRSTPSGSSR